MKELINASETNRLERLSALDQNDRFCYCCRCYPHLTMRNKMGNTRSRVMKTLVLTHYLILILMMPQSSAAHSNINSVWLSKDEPTESAPQQEPVKYHIKSQSAINTDNNALTSNQISYRSMPDAPSRQLQVSSSSLLPAIVSLDQESERRSDTDSSAPPGFSARPDYVGNRVPPPISAFNNEASSLDSLWSVNQTNAQVQFDEEHGQQASGGAGYESQRAHRRQDNETSTLAPKHQVPATEILPAKSTDSADADSSADQALGQELNLPGSKAMSNSSQQFGKETSGVDNGQSRPAFDVHILSAAAAFNQTQKQADVLNRNTTGQQSPFIYYVPDGYKWNPSESFDNISDAQASGSRRKLHSSGTQYDLRESRDKLARPSASYMPRSTIPPPVSVAVSDTSAYSTHSPELMDAARASLAHELYRLNLPAQEKLNPPSLTYGIVPQSLNQQQQPIKFFGTTQAPIYLSRFIPAASQLYKHLPVFVSDNQAIASRKSSMPQQHQPMLPPRLVSRPQRFPNYQYSTSADQPLAQWPVGSRRDTTGWRVQSPKADGSIGANRVRHSANKQTLSRARHQKLQSNNKKEKKSLLGAIGSRLTSWVEPSVASASSAISSNQNRDKDHEETFYEIGNKNGKRSPLAGAQWSAANFYLVDATRNDLAMLTNLVHPPTPLPNHHRTPHSPLAYPSALYAAPVSPVRQPTVAPAPSSLDKFFGTDGLLHSPLQPTPEVYLRSTRRRRYPTLKVHANSVSETQGLHQKGVDTGAAVQQQPASFIPVVAVSVTKTSPAPRPVEGGGTGERSGNSDRGNTELYDYLELKTGQKQSQDDYGNMASGSVNRDSGLSLHNYPATSKAHATLRPANDQLTTTVKSAVFGYLPHEANKPLMDALSAVPHYATRAQLASDAIAGHAELDPRNPLLTQQAGNGDLAGSLEDPPSLALQLQANNFAQNDIAHPFSTQLKAYHSPTVSGQAGKQRGVPIGAIYPANQAQYHGFQLFHPTDSQHPQILTAAATELNPLLMPVMFASPYQQQVAYGSPKSQYALLDQSSSSSGSSSNQDQQDANDQSASSSVSSASAYASDSSDNDSESEPNQSVNKGNKKRSGEFFASAGQLLLSALPLLLAPTLGLMFASAPLPVARYHAPTDSFSGGSSSMQSGIPGSYLSSLNQGQVQNSSPVQLFTPSPPVVYNQTTPTVGGSSSTTTSKPTTPLTSPISTPTTQLPSTSVRPNSNGGQRAVQVLAANTQQLSSGASAGSIVRATGVGNRTSQGPQRITLTLTTPSYGNESDLLGVAPHDLSDPKHHVATNTLLLLTNDEDADGGSAIEGDKSFANGTRQQVAHYSVGHSSHAGGGNSEQLAGYDGVDFDAQYPSLRKTSLTSSIKLIAPDQPQHDPNQSTTRRKPAQSSAGDQEPIAKKDVQNGGNAAQNPDDTDQSTGTKLYPLSTWPPLRRRTVSLVTSNGNKTLLDASEKYQNIDYYSEKPTRLKPLAAPKLAARNNTASETTNYAEPNFDDSEGGDDVLLAPSKYTPTKQELTNKQTQGTSADRQQQQYQSQVHSLDQNAPMDFLFSNGLATVSLTSEPMAARRAARSKRSVGIVESTNATHPSKRGRLVKKVRRVVRFRRRPMETANDTAQTASNSSQHLVEAPSSVAGVVDPSAESNQTSEANTNSTDILRVGASSGKSAHVIAAMVAHLENEEEEAAAAATRRRRANRGRNWPPNRAEVDDYQPIAGDPGSLSDNELRDLLLRKKAALDRTPTPQPGDNRRPPAKNQSGDGRHAFAVDSTDSSDYDTDDQERFQEGPNQGGKPLEVTSTRFRFYANGTAVKSKQRDADTPAGFANGTQLELSDRTKKALANIGSVLFREGLGVGHELRQQDGQIERRKQAKRSRQRNGLGDTNWRTRRFRPPDLQQVDEPDDGVGTERSLLRATPTPVQPDDEAFGLGDEDSVSLSAREALVDRPSSRNASESMNAYQVARNRGQRGDEFMGPSLFIKDDDLAEMRRMHNNSQATMRDRVNLFENGGRNNAFGASDERPDISMNDEYHVGRHSSSAPSDNSYQQHNRSAGNVDWNFYKSEPSNSNNVGFYPNRLDALFRPSNNTDRRAETGGYANEKQQPAYYPAGYSQINRPPATDPVQHGRYQQPDYHQPQHQYNQAPSQNYMQYPPPPSGGYSQPPLPGDQHDQSYHQQNATAYAPQPLYATPYLPQRPTPAPLQSHRPQPSNDYPMVSNGYNSNRPDNNYPPVYSNQHPPPPLPPPAPTQHQPLRHNPAYGQFERYPMTSDAYSQKYYPPATRYPSAAWPPNHQADQSQSTNYYPPPAPPATPMQPMVSGLMQHGGPLALMSSHDRTDSRAVNEYLKRVQFSDSDRDKLMASYLTCDGLLNDNDHCLERLSCEFSDPQNIEKANKLDRAVSSM